MSKIYCFLDENHSQYFLNEFNRFISLERMPERVEFDTQNGFDKLFSRIANLKNSELIFIFHPIRKKNREFRLQVIGKNWLVYNHRKENFYACNLYLLRNKIEYFKFPSIPEFIELEKKDFLTTLEDDELVLAMLDYYRSDSWISSGLAFDKVEKKLLEIRNLNYLLEKHKLLESDLMLRDLIGVYENEMDYYVVNRFLRLRDKELEGADIISSENESLHMVSIDLEIQKSNLSLVFDFSQNSLRETRIFALVGKNATGKSQTLLKVAESNLPRYYKNVFLYGFEGKRNTKDSSYRYINLLTSRKSLIKEEIGKIINLDKRSSYFDRIKLLKDIALNVLGITDAILLMGDGNFVSLFDKKFKDVVSSKEVISVIDIEVLSNNSSYLSTGQNYFLKFVVSIIANVKYSSVLLIDEPEIFLHPNYIKELIQALEQVCKHTNSICILSTHSVFVVREMPREYVRILQKDKKTGELFVRTPANETFGESLDVLAEDIFHDEETESLGDKFIKQGTINLKSLSSRLASKVLNND